MKRKSLFLALVLMLMFSRTVFAAEVDKYGNPIDWDVTAGGNEDMAHVTAEPETDPVSEVAVITGTAVPEVPETYASEEQESILDQISELGVFAEPEGTGLLKAVFEVPEKWPGANPILVFYGPGGKRQQTVCYRTNGYVSQEQFPAGEYTVYRAYIVGDEQGEKYPLAVDPMEFVIEDGGITEVAIRYLDLREIAESAEPVVEEIAETQITEMQEEIPEEKGTAWAKILLAVISVAAAASIAIIVFVKKRSRSKYLE